MIRWWQQLSTRRPKLVLGISAFIIVILGWYASGLFSRLSQDEMSVTATTPSREMDAKMTEKFGASPTAQIVLFERRDATLGTADSAAYQAEVARLLAPLRSQFRTVQTYTEQRSPALLSRDNTATYAILSTDKTRDDTYRMLSDFARTADQSKLKVSIGGEAASIKQTTQAANEFLVHAELVSLPILLVLLLFFFRSGVAALLPLVMSGVTIVGAFAIARGITGFMQIDTYAVNVITILGLGLSIDYALLSVNRFREELGRWSVERAVETIIVTTGRTIFFSGITVIACLLSLLVFPIAMLHSIAIGVTAAVAMAVIFTVVVLPALLQLIGRRIDALHLPVKRHDGQSVFWSRVAHTTTSHPLISMIVGFAVVTVAVIPLGKFNAGQMDYAWLARGSSSQYVAQYLNDHFATRAPSVTTLVVMPAGTSSAQRFATLCDVAKKLRHVQGVTAVVSAALMSPDRSECLPIEMISGAQQGSLQEAALVTNYSRGDALKFDVSLADKVGSRAAADALAAIRAVRPSLGSYYVGGAEAMLVDDNQLYFDAIPWAAGTIVVSMLILLALTLRSVALPLQAIIINSIALAISMAAVVGIFQLGWFHGVTGWLQTSGIVLTAPILVVAIAFGLAMDYSVFLYSRMREVYDKTGSATEAIVEGVVKTGPIITAAALALFVVVVAFAGSAVMFMQIIGVGLGIAVLVDAFFVRLILVPSIMALMGRSSWYAPKWLSRWVIRHE